MSVWEAGLDLGDSVRERVGWGPGGVVPSRVSALSKSSLSSRRKKRPVGERTGLGAWTVPLAAGCTHICYFFRTKWKRQTAVGLELLAEAGNYSALQRMFPSPYFYHPSLLGSMDSTTAAAAAAAMYSSMYRTPPAPHPQLQRPLVPRVLIHGLGPGGQPALNPLSNPIPGTPHPR